MISLVALLMVTSQVDTIAISGDGPCATSCGLVVDSIATLGKMDDPVALSGSSKIVRISNGSFYVAETYAPGVVTVFDPNGSFRGTMGRAGDGPGEFRRIQRLKVDAGDNLHMFEGSRHTVWHPDSAAPLHVNRLPIRPVSETFTSSGVLVAYYWPYGDGVAPQLHSIDIARGLITDSWARAPLPPLDDRDAFIRRLGPGVDEHVWAADLADYKLERWEVGGDKDVVLRRTPSWFVSVTEGGPRSLATVVESVREDPEGLLWVLINVPRRGRSATARPAGHGPVIRDAPARNFDTVLEVLDLRQRRVVARHRFEGNINTGGFLGDGRTVASLRERPDGLIVADVWRFSLVPNSH